jgi:hypothetical protein
MEIDGLAPSPGGAYGTDLYAAVNGAVLRVNPVSGAFITFATGLATGNQRPSGLAFDPGTFVTGLLYVLQNNGSVVTVSPAGTVRVFSNWGTLFSSNDLAFARAGNAFGSNLFVSNGPFGPGNLSKVDVTGDNSVFAPTSSFAKVPVGLAFPPAESAFGRNLYASLANGTIVQVDPRTKVTTFARGLGLAIDLAFSAGGAFGDNLYVSDPQSQSILRVDSSGAVSTFATGFRFTRNGFDADLVFSVNGNTLFVAEARNIVAITTALSGVIIPQPSPRANGRWHSRSAWSQPPPGEGQGLFVTVPCLTC